jgi:hypothetical protein
MSTKNAPKATEYRIAEITLINALPGGRFFTNGVGWTIEECDASRGGYWVADHRGPKWWVPGSNVISCKYDVAKPAEVEKRSEIAADVRS